MKNIRTFLLCTSLLVLGACKTRDHNDSVVESTLPLGDLIQKDLVSSRMGCWIDAGALKGSMFEIWIDKKGQGEISLVHKGEYYAIHEFSETMLKFTVINSKTIAEIWMGKSEGKLTLGPYVGTSVDGYTYRGSLETKHPSSEFASHTVPDIKGTHNINCTFSKVR